MTTAALILLIITILYGGLILFNMIGWLKLPTIQQSNSEPETRISLIIALRNEANNIHNLIRNIQNLAYPINLLEVFLIDDDSDDGTFHQLVELCANLKNLNVVQNQNDGGKKNALSYGISLSQGSLIVVTDADCRMQSHWLNKIESFYRRENYHFISGPVRMNGSSSLFHKFQEVEFSSLIVSGAGTLGWELPTMCNGANMAFTRTAFQRVGGYENDQFASGDDMFLMWKIAKEYGNEWIGFLKDDEAIIDTDVVSDLKGFYNQRIRWVSKSSGYTDFMTIITALIVFLTNVAVLLYFPLLFFVQELMVPWFILFGVKFLTDFSILLLINDFFKRKKNLWYYPMIQIMTIIYTTVIGVFGQFASFNWKNRGSEK